MTRKKFIKRLGGYGITRNTANKMAKVICKHSSTYEYGWDLFQSLIDEMKRRVKEAVMEALLYGEGTAKLPMWDAYFPMYSQALDFEIKPLNDPAPWRYLYAIDTAHVESLPVVKWTRVNPHIQGGTAHE